MEFLKLFVQYLPVIFASLIFLVIFGLYGLSLIVDQINPLFPLVGDLGVDPPGAPLLTFFLLLFANLTLIFVIVRYQAYKKMLLEQKNSDENAHNVSFVTGIALVIALLGTGSFRFDEMLFVQAWHCYFAIMFFLFYLFDQICEINIASRIGHEQKANCIRKCLFITNVFLLIGLFTFVILAFVQLPDAFFDKDLRMNWSNNNPGYWYHLIGSLFEWCFILSSIIYLLTYRTMFVNYQIEIFDDELLMSGYSKSTSNTIDINDTTNDDLSG